MLLHFHPLFIYRHQVIKQADVVLATVLLPDQFTHEQRKRIFEYYDPLTTGDSSLSESMQSIAAAWVGNWQAANDYLLDAVERRSGRPGEESARRHARGLRRWHVVGPDLSASRACRTMATRSTSALGCRPASAG